MWAKIFNLNNSKQFVMMKDITPDGKFVNQIFTNSPEKHKKKVPFVLFFQQIFNTERERDIVFNEFDEIQAINFLNQIDNSMNVKPFIAKPGQA